MPGHLRAKCPMLLDEAVKQAKIAEGQQKEEDQKKEEDILLRESADPLPIVHHHGCVRWQGERGESVGQGRADSSSVG